MRFSIFSIVALFFPAAFLALGLAEHRREVAAIQWEAFSLASMQHHLEDGRPALVLGAPQGIVKSFSIMALGEFDSAIIRKHCYTENYAMLKFEYTPWGDYDSSIQAELEWMGEHGGYKEPSLVLVEPDGTTSAIKHIISSGRVSDFLLGNSKPTRKSVYFWISALSLTVWAAGIMFGRRKSACVE